MLYDDVADPEETSPEELRDAYLSELATVIDERGVDAVADESGVDRETVAAVADGIDDPQSSDGEGVANTLTLEDAAAIQATDDDAPAADDILLEARDNLLMGMTTAVLDVDTIGAEIDADLDGKQIHQKVEGRSPMTLGEYATLQHFIASRQR